MKIKSLVVLGAVALTSFNAFGGEWNLKDVKCDGRITLGGADGKSVTTQDIHATMPPLKSNGHLDLLMGSPLRDSTELRGPYRGQQLLTIPGTNLTVKLTVVFVAPAAGEEGLTTFASVRETGADGKLMLHSLGGGTTPWTEVATTSLRAGYLSFDPAVQQAMAEAGVQMPQELAAQGKIAPNSFVDLSVSCSAHRDADAK